MKKKKKKQGVIQKLFLENGILNSDLTINESKIKPILVELKKGLKQYLSIQRSVYLADISKDKIFQNMFNTFYGIIYKKENWQKIFYIIFEASKRKKRYFEDVLKIIKKKTGDFDPVFASKLVATLNPHCPVVDSVVLKNLSLNKEYQELSRLKDISNRLKRTEDLYKKLVEEFDLFLSTKDGRNLIKRFDKEYPYAQITEVKILDLILWQLRKKRDS